MSASEMLRALAATGTPGPWERAGAKGRDPDGPGVRGVDHFDWVATAQVSNVPEWRENTALLVALRNALPFIADVVEAAERVDRFRVQYEGAMITLGWTFGDVLAMTANHQALTALQAHLKGATLRDAAD